MTKMPTLNLYLDDKTKKRLKDIALSENRSPSKQVKHILEFYLKYKDKVK
jgi:predicted transcriptional regulator